MHGPDSDFAHSIIYCSLAELVTLPIVGSLLYPLVSSRPALRYAIKRRHADYTMSELDYLYAATHQLGAQHAPLALIAGDLAYDVSGQMDTLQQPTLIVWGSHALNDTRSIPGHLPKRTQVILLQNSGTYVHEELPETVVANIKEWSKTGQVAIAAGSKPTAETSETAVSSPPAIQENVVEPSDTPVVETSEATVSNTPADQEDTEGLAGVREVEAYCVKCKKKVVMQNPQEVTTKNGRPALRGTCPVCGTGLFRIGHA